MNFLARIVYWTIVACFIIIPLRHMGASFWQSFAICFGVCLAEGFHNLEKP